MKKMLLISTVLVALVGCGDESELKRLTKERLKDPESARFGAITVLKDTACVTVSAKNGYGGYGNADQFMFDRKGDSWKFYINMEFFHEDCVRLMSKRGQDK